GTALCAVCNPGFPTVPGVSRSRGWGRRYALSATLGSPRPTPRPTPGDRPTRPAELPPIPLVEQVDRHVHMILGGASIEDGQPQHIPTVDRRGRQEHLPAGVGVLHRLPPSPVVDG